MLYQEPILTRVTKEYERFQNEMQTCKQNHEDPGRVGLDSLLGHLNNAESEIKGLKGAQSEDTEGTIRTVENQFTDWREEAKTIVKLL